MTETTQKPDQTKGKSQFDLEQRVTQLEKKLFALHSAFVSETGMAALPPEHPSSYLAPIEVSFDPDATTTVIAAAGMAMRLGIAPREFRRSLSAFNCNFIFIKDFKQAWYQLGLLGVTRNLGETTDYLKSIIPSQTTELLAVGASAGGFAAISLGVRLGATRVLAFGPQTKVSGRAFKKFGTIDSQKAEFDFDSPDTDLCNILDDNPDYAGRIKVYFSRRNAGDRKDVMRIADYPQIEPVPVDAEIHNVAEHLQKLGQLDNIIAEFMTG